MRIKELDDKLYYYYKIDTKIKRYEDIIEQLRKEREVVEKRIKNKDWKSSVKSKSIEYGINVQTSKRGSSVESAIISKEEELISESRILRKNILKFQKEIVELKCEKNLMDIKLGCLSEAYREILHDYYKLGKEISRNKRKRALKELGELYE